jgi:HAD superfamily hydrolase (TIGR01549 family)
LALLGRSNGAVTLPLVRAVAGVVFDMDGTLVDSLPVALESYRRVILEFDGPDRSHDEILGSFSIGPAREMLAHLIGRPVGDAAIARYESVLSERASEIHPYAGVQEAVARLAGALPLAVFTAANSRAASIVLEATGLRSFFSTVVGADLVERTKPAPEGLIEAARRLELEPADVAYVGDGPSDVATARACGALAVAAGWGHQHDPARDADVVAESPADLVSLLLPSATAPAEP